MRQLEYIDLKSYQEAEERERKEKEELSKRMNSEIQKNAPIRELTKEESDELTQPLILKSRTGRYMIGYPTNMVKPIRQDRKQRRRNKRSINAIVKLRKDIIVRTI